MPNPNGNTFRTRTIPSYFLAGLVLLVATYLALPWRILYNGTPSVPTGWYLLHKDQSPKLGDLTTAKYQEPAWARSQSVPIPDGLLLLKHIMAVAGDDLRVDGNLVLRCIEGACTPIGKRLPDGYKGMHFPSLELPAQVPEGYVYLGTDYEKGWDSRYLGLFPVEALQGVAEPLFTD